MSEGKQEFGKWEKLGYTASTLSQPLGSCESSYNVALHSHWIHATRGMGPGFGRDGCLQQRAISKGGLTAKSILSPWRS